MKQIKGQEKRHLHTGTIPFTIQGDYKNSQQVVVRHQHTAAVNQNNPLHRFMFIYSVFI